MILDRSIICSIVDVMSHLTLHLSLPIMKTLSLLLILSIAPIGLIASSFKIDSSMITVLTLKNTENGDFYIIGTWKENARARFAKFTRKNIGKTIDIIIGGKVISSPRVSASITRNDFAIPCSGYESAIEIFSKLRMNK